MFLQLYRLIHYIMNESICKEIISGIIYSRKSLEGIMMIRLNVLELLEKKGKTRYWLYKKLGMSYQNFNNIIHNNTKSIRFTTIEALCDILECTPNELFIITQ